MTHFEDHFSKQARNYARYRPRYPGELFAWLASAAPARHRAWDCGTGNGQAALGLASYFEQVIATDASAEQLALAAPHERIEYRLGRAEDIGLEPASIDLVTVAAAIHWFDLPSFHDVVRRVAVPDGVLAVWTYHQPSITPAIDRIVTEDYAKVVAGCWPESFRYVADRYRSLPFPFEEIRAPAFEIQALWDLEHFVGFLGSWSAAQRYREERGESPVEVILPELSRAWGDPHQPRPIRWPLYLRVGRVR